MGRLGGKAASGAGGGRGLAASQGAGWLAATASRRWAAPAAAMWLAVATRACSTVPCKCAEEKSVSKSVIPNLILTGSQPGVTLGAYVVLPRAGQRAGYTVSL